LLFGAYGALFAFSGFADGPRLVLATIQRLALMGVKLLLDGGLRVPSFRFSDELRVAFIADSEHRSISDSFDDPKVAFLHDCSLAHLAGRQ
jgi:hypothetical protein